MSKTPGLVLRLLRSDYGEAAATGGTVDDHSMSVLRLQAPAFTALDDWSRIAFPSIPEAET